MALFTAVNPKCTRKIAVPLFSGALLSESGAGIGPGARSSGHGPPPALKLELPGTGRAGPGPPSPRGAMAGGGPGPPSASPQPNMANHVSVISKPQAPVPAPPSSLDVRSQNHVAPAPAPFSPHGAPAETSSSSFLSKLSPKLYLSINHLQ